MRVLKKELWPHSIELPYFYENGRRTDEKMNQWCTANIGKRFKDWYSYRIDDHKVLFSFKDTETLLAFKITWGYNENKKRV